MLAIFALVGVSIASRDTQAHAATANSIWPSTGHDSVWSNWNADETTVTPAQVKVMKLNYSIPTAADPNNICLYPIGPLTSGGKLYDVGPDGISAYNQWSGARLWNVPLADDSLNVRMQIAGNNLVVAQVDCESNTNAHSLINVLDLTTGAPAYPTWVDHYGLSAMAVAGNVLLTVEYNDDTQQVVAHTLSGQLLWTTPAGWSAGPLVTLGSMVFVNTDTGELDALNINTGAVVWHSFGVAPIAASQDGTSLYTLADSTILEVNPGTGTFKTVEVNGRGSRVMAIDKTTIYTACAGTALCATSRTDGHSVWITETGNQSPGGPIVVAAGVVYYAGRSFLATTGVRIKSAADGVNITSVSGGRVYGLKIANGEPTAIVSYK